MKEWSGSVCRSGRICAAPWGRADQKSNKRLDHRGVTPSLSSSYHATTIWDALQIACPPHNEIKINVGNDRCPLLAPLGRPEPLLPLRLDIDRLG